ncbi:bifunctional adenosine 5'-phosphosulfate phosphorylase/adenylylsulfatase HINT4 isoform X2 [Malania oleifera]|uniref:bifunctional adenosine 5'-phosphosulfate phosphorylase/adenylylsulfatase HINT4 isoform X2 n=1 Tax=Malania oleifera TaxID=397392 RepID=UPI0025AE9AA8|nr:bifunctional adenosine 5'-phosphosulfate phosphorylase/adenylylsulfatase HINT4 isoform X2 [Malania oleifera]
MAGASSRCIFCQIALSSTSTTLLHSDERVVAFEDINPSAFRHYLVVPVEHISTVHDLQRRTEDYSLVSHMLNVGQTLLRRDAPQCEKYRFGFHQPPLNSVNHLHLHCLALPFTPRSINFCTFNFTNYSISHLPAPGAVLLGHGEGKDL